MVRAPQSWLAQELGGSDPVDEDDDRRRVIRGSGRLVRIVSVLPVPIRGIDTARDVSVCALRDRRGHQLQCEIELPSIRFPFRHDAGPRYVLYTSSLDGSVPPPRWYPRSSSASAACLAFSLVWPIEASASPPQFSGMGLPRA